MTLSLGRGVRAIAACLGFALALLGLGPSVALAAASDPGSRHGSDRVGEVPLQVALILSVLEHRMGSNGPPERARDKLLTLSEERLRLIASLSKRIANAGQTAGADLALLLIAALIVLD